MTEKIKISMVKYDNDGKPVDVAYGNYKPQDVAIFKKEGYIEVNEGLARRIDKELTNKLEDKLSTK